MTNTPSAKPEQPFFKRPLIIVVLAIFVLALIANFVVSRKLNQINPPPLEIYAPQKTTSQPAAPQPTTESSQTTSTEQPATDPVPTAQ